MFILDILIEIVGYTTARFLLPLVSFGKVYVQPVNSNKRGFNALGFRFEENNKKIEVEATMAGWLGFFVWLAATILVIYFIRTADERAMRVSALQDGRSRERQFCVGALDENIQHDCARLASMASFQTIS